MKKRTTRTTDVLDAEIDFARFGPVRRNAFAGANETDGPSLLALWEMPELAPTARPVRRGTSTRATASRPVVRPVELPADVWEKIAVKARAKRLDVDEALRDAVAAWLRGTG